MFFNSSFSSLSRFPLVLSSSILIISIFCFASSRFVGISFLSSWEIPIKESAEELSPRISAEKLTLVDSGPCKGSLHYKFYRVEDNRVCRSSVDAQESFYV